MVANVLAVVGLFLAEGGSSVAGPGSPSLARTAAQATLAEGNRRLKDGDVAGAIADYRRAQGLYPPAAGKIEFNIAKAEETRGDEPAAAAAFDRFLSQALEIPPAYREEARDELRRLSAALGALRLAEKRPGYEVLVDGREHGKTPLDRDVWVRPGRHVITLEQDNRVLFRDEVTVESGATVQITVTIRHPDAAETPSRTPVPAIALSNPSSSATAPPPLPRLAALPTPDGPGPERMAATTSDDGRAPVWKRWWFWTAAGAVVAGSATLLILSSRDSCPSSYSCSKPFTP